MILRWCAWFHNYHGPVIILTKFLSNSTETSPVMYSYVFLTHYFFCDKFGDKFCDNSSPAVRASFDFHLDFFDFEIRINKMNCAQCHVRPLSSKVQQPPCTQSVLLLFFYASNQRKHTWVNEQQSLCCLFLDLWPEINIIIAYPAVIFNHENMSLARSCLILRQQQWFDDGRRVR